MTRGDLADLGRGLAQAALVEVDQHDLRAVLGERRGHGAADALRRARHDVGLALERAFAQHTGRCESLLKTGQLTPVPPRPQ